jgi:YVTN family beta-propeller protein
MGLMKKGLLVGVGVATAMVMGCSSGQAAKNSAASGSLALSSDDGLLYAADTDNGVVSVIDTKTDEKLYDVKVGNRPMRVAVGQDDTLYVANRGSRSVSVVRKGERQVSTEIATGVDPTGMAMSLDGKTLYIVSATAKDTSDYGTIQAVDTATLNVKYEANIGAEPRAIALVSNDKALVTQYRGQDKGSNIVEVNLKTGEVMNDLGNNLIYDSINKTKVGDPTNSAYSSFKTRAMTDVVVTPDGTRAFVPAVLAREDAIGRKPSSSGGYYSSGGPCNVGSVASEGIVTLDTSANSATQPRTDDVTDCASRGTNDPDADFPPTAVGSGSGVSTFSGTTSPSTKIVEAVQGPSAAAVDPTGEWLFVVNKETSNVAVMPAWRRQGRDGENIDFNRTGSSFRSVVGVAETEGLSSGSDGIALTKDGLRAYVYNQFDHKVVRLGNPEGGPTSDVVKVKTIDLGLKDTLTADQAAGRRNFFDASSTVMSSSLTHVACSTCHLEGRDDGHVWSFPDGHRQTPTLVGRALKDTAPYHWTAQFNDFNAFMTHTVISRMGGSGTTETANNQMLAWLANEPAPENANVRAQLTEQQQRGQVAFAKANCGSCHAGTNYTDSSVVNTVLHDVGVHTQGDALANFDTPSLRGLARSAPYLHDGSAGTLLDRLAGTSTQHGDLSVLSDQDKLDLVEYLKTL